MKEHYLELDQSCMYLDDILAKIDEVREHHNIPEGASVEIIAESGQYEDTNYGANLSLCFTWTEKK